MPFDPSRFNRTLVTSAWETSLQSDIRKCPNVQLVSHVCRSESICLCYILRGLSNSLPHVAVVVVVDAAKRLGATEMELIERVNKIAEQNPDVTLSLVLNKVSAAIVLHERVSRSVLALVHATGPPS